MNSHIYNLQERTECTKTEPKLRLWVANYEIPNIVKGIAIIKASNAAEANNTLVSNSQFNSMKSSIIARIEEIITDGMSTDLVVEEFVEYNN